MEQFKAAFTRALLGAIVIFALTFLTALQTEEPARRRARARQRPVAASAINAGIAALTYLVTRGGIEGGYDRHRDANNRVKPGDVGAPAGGGG